MVEISRSAIVNVVKMMWHCEVNVRLGRYARSSKKGLMEREIDG